MADDASLMTSVATKFKTKQGDYTIAIAVSVVLHLAVIILLFFNLIIPAKEQPMSLALNQRQDVEIIKAVAVNQEQVTDVVERLEQQKRAEQQREIARQKQLAEQARQARIQRENAAKVAAEKQRQKLLQQKKAAEEKHLAKIAAEKKKIEQQRQAEAKRVAALKKQEQERKVAEAKKQAELKKVAQAKRQAEEERKVAAAKAAEEQRIAAQREAARQQRIQDAVTKYKALIVAAMEQNWIEPPNADPSLLAKFYIRLAPGGTVLSVQLTKSSGDPVYDRSARTAILKSSPLPVPTSTELFNSFRELNLDVQLGSQG